MEIIKVDEEANRKLMTSKRVSYYYKLDMNAQTTILPSFVHYVGFELEAYLALVLVTGLFLTRPKSWKALRSGKAHEWTVLFMPFLMFTVTKISFLTIEFNITILSLLWICVAGYSKCRLFAVEKEEKELERNPG